MAYEANSRKFQLKPEININDIESLLTDLNQGSSVAGSKISKKYLKYGSYPAFVGAQFEVTYLKEKFRDAGYLSPTELQRILIEVQRYLVFYAKVADPTTFRALPDEETSEAYQAFYFQGRYSPSNFDPENQALQKTVVQVLDGVAKKIKQPTAQAVAEATHLDNISELSYSFRSGNLEENWVRDQGVKKFAQYLLALPTEPALTIQGKDFGRATEVYAFEHGLDALSEYHRFFKEILPLHQNFHQQEQRDNDTLHKVLAENYPYFNRGIFAATLISYHQLEGKIELDNQRLREFIELFDQVIEILKKPGLSDVVAAAAETEAGGETEPEPEKRVEEKHLKLIEFEDFYQNVANTAIQQIFDLYYAAAVTGNLLLNSDAKLAVRLKIISTIQERILSHINLKQALRKELGSGRLAHKYQNERVIVDEETENLVIEFLEGIIVAFNDPKQITEDVTVVVSELEGIVGEEKPMAKPVLRDSDLAVVPESLFKYYKKLQLTEAKDFAEWEGSRIDHWLNLNRSQRLEFLRENAFLQDYLNAYSAELSIEFFQLYLAKNNLSHLSTRDFHYILSMMQVKVWDELLDVSPLKFETNVNNFINKNSAEVLKIQQFLNVSFGFEVERAIANYAEANYHDLILDQIRGKSIEEAALIVNPEITDVGKILDSASSDVLEILYQTFQFPDYIRLDGYERLSSLKLIENYLTDYLLAHPEALRHLFSATPTKRQLFFSKHLNDFWTERSSFFAPTIEEIGNEVYRQFIIKKLTQQAGGGSLYELQLNNDLRYIFSQAIIAQVDPTVYITDLSDHDLAKLFDLPKSFTNFTEFKQLLLDYIDRSRKILKLDQIIYEKNQVFDQDEFTKDVLNLREIGGRASLINGGYLILSALTVPASDQELLEDDYVSLDEIARQEYVRQRILTEAIWAAYTAEQQALIQAEAEQQHLLSAQSLAVYDWARIVDQHEKDQNKEKRPGIIKRGLKNGVDKMVTTGATTAAGAVAGVLIPGAGVALTSVLNAIPIPDKYKKYLATGILGGVLGLTALTLKLFISSAGGFIGGLLGGVGGFLIGGLPGIVPGWAAGTWAGYGVEQAIKGFFGDLGTGINSLANNIGNGIGNALNGAWNGLKGAWNSIFGGGGAQTATATAFPAIPYGVQVAVPSTLIGGGVLVATLQHSSYLEQPPELLSYSQDSSAKYVEISKTVSPSNLANNETATLTYSVTITPQADYAITVSEVTDQIVTLGADGVANNATIDATQITNQLPANTTISSPTTITYSVPNVSGTDISINNEFELTFFVDDGGEIKTETARDNANVTIGEPELGCFVFGEAGQEVRDDSGAISVAWNSEDRAKIIKAYGEVLDSPTFMSLICGDGPITIYRLPESNYGGWALSESSIGIYDLGVSSQNSANYTLIHEMGHLIDYRNPGLRNSFQSIWSGSCFTYPYKCFAAEPFAEIIALYRIYSYHYFTRLNSTYNFPVLYPAEYCWAENNIYGESTSYCD